MLNTNTQSCSLGIQWSYPRNKLSTCIRAVLTASCCLVLNGCTAILRMPARRLSMITLLFLIAGTDVFAQQYCASKSEKEMTVTCSRYDPNGSPDDPDWALHSGPQHELPLSSHNDNCFKKPDSADCTDQSVTTTRDPAPWWNQCFIGSALSGGYNGHINWTPATLEGRLGWMNFANDSDINLQLVRDDQAGVTAENDRLSKQHESSPDVRLMEVEFASGETMARFASPWWYSLHQAILDANYDESNGNRNAYVPVRQQLHPACADVPPRGVVYGLFGLDCVHGCRSELHPAYAVALQVDASRAANKWALFARNFGDEGDCSTQQHPLGGKQVKILLPYSGTGTPELVSPETQFATTDPSNIHFPTIHFIPGQGILVEFSLTDASSADLAELFLTVKWTGAQEDETDCQQPPYGVTALTEQQLLTLSDRTEESDGRAATPASRHARYQQSLTTMALTAGRYRKSRTVPVPADAKIQVENAAASDRYSLRPSELQNPQALPKPQIDREKSDIARRAQTIFCSSLPSKERSRSKECSAASRGTPR